MFNADFYPTPETLIKKMLEGLNFRKIRKVLEPSAGKGDLAEGIKQAFKNYTYRCELDMDTIEKEPELRMILKGKGFRVVCDDFLKYETYTRYDLIIANPPFSQGAKHLLKMIEMQERSGGGIICLLNAETLKNPCTAERKTLAKKLDEYNATITYEVGAFAHAERKTDIEIAITKILIPTKEKKSFILTGTLKKAEDLRYKEKSQDTHYIAENDFLQAIIKQYNIEVEAGIRLIDEFNAMKPHILSSFDKDEGKRKGSILDLVYGAYSEETEAVTYNGFVRAVRRKYWKALFTNPKFTGKLTSNLLSEYQNKVKELADYEFSIENINNIKTEMMRQVAQGVEDTIIALFDELSHKYSYCDDTKNNIHYYNGWQTNKSWLINKKVIIPLDAYKSHYYTTHKSFEPTQTRVVFKLSDVEKSLNYLNTKTTSSTDMEAVLMRAEADGVTKKIPLKYFTVTFYKKGTCHIEFTDLELLKKFNIFGSQKKGWLPPCYGEKSYGEMEAEEKRVIDDFEGEDSYRETMQSGDYYLTGASGVLALEQHNKDEEDEQ